MVQNVSETGRWIAKISFKFAFATTKCKKPGQCETVNSILFSKPIKNKKVRLKNRTKTIFYCLKKYWIESKKYLDLNFFFVIIFIGILPSKLNKKFIFYESLIYSGK